MPDPLSIAGVSVASRMGEFAGAACPGWSWQKLSGRITELSGGAGLTLGFDLIFEAQAESEPVAWVSCRDSLFYPADALARGVDLSVLPIVQVPGGGGAAQAADHLMRSGAFALVVVDLGAADTIPAAAQSRLLGLAQRHHTALVLLVASPLVAPPLAFSNQNGRKAGARGSTRAGNQRTRRAGLRGPLVSLRVEAWRTGLGDGDYRCGLKVLKDKRHGPSWSQEDDYRGPSGLR